MFNSKMITPPPQYDVSFSNFIIDLLLKIGSAFAITQRYCFFCINEAK